jgi:mutator protein MutT
MESLFFQGAFVTQRLPTGAPTVGIGSKTGRTMELVSMKRTSEFIAYRFMNGEPVLFLQKRTKDAPVAPGVFGIFGGQIEEGEDPETALLREVREELDYLPRNVKFFRRYEHSYVEQYVFTCKVDDNFEKEITVREGEYGRFLTQSELMAEKVIEVDRIVFDDVFRWLETHSCAEDWLLNHRRAVPAHHNQHVSNAHPAISGWSIRHIGGRNRQHQFGLICADGNRGFGRYSTPNSGWNPSWNQVLRSSDRCVIS